MNRIELAVRRYHELVPQPVAGHHLPHRELQVWLTDYFRPAVADCVGWPTFREYAAWPVQTLRPGAKTAERQLIEKIDLALQGCGSAVLRLVEFRRVRAGLEQLVRPVLAARGSITIDDNDLPQTSVAAATPLESLLEISQVRAIANRDGNDLVQVDDYFEPRQEWVETQKGPPLQRGDWIVACNPELLPIGNFVERCVAKRIRQRHKLLCDVIAKCQRVMRQQRSQYKRAMEDVAACRLEMDQAVEAFESAFFSGHDTQLRDACVTVTQVHVALDPAPDLLWLGLERDTIEQGREWLRARLTRGPSAALLDRVCGALHDLQQLYRNRHPRRSDIDEAIASGGLVIVESLQEVYWERAKLENGINGREWDFFLALVRQGQRAADVTEADVFDRPVGPGAMSTTWGRLKTRLPRSLRNLVAPGPDRRTCRTYRLSFDQQRIYIFS